MPMTNGLLEMIELAAGLGIEPRFTASKAAVLPLDDPAMFLFLSRIMYYKEQRVAIEDIFHPEIEDGSVDLGLRRDDGKKLKQKIMKYELPQLPYAYDALEPFIDAQTMEIHHTKHHQAYVTKLNEALEKHPDVAERPLAELLADLDSVPDDIRTAVRNHGGGHSNHSFFWTIMTAPHVAAAAKAESDPLAVEPSGEIGKIIHASFGGFPAFKEAFGKAAAGVFGSGWTWLVKKEDGTFEIVSTGMQDSPLMKKQTPILGLDVWEHAYYLKSQNKRPDYIDAWWNVVNWEEVEKKLGA